MTDNETYRGALNRVNNARIYSPDADFWIGIEGGLCEVNLEMRAFAWVVIVSKDGMVGTSRTADFALPDKVVALIREGKELGEADDIVFGRSNSKQSNGSVGILTKDVITRTSYYEQSVILALI